MSDVDDAIPELDLSVDKTDEYRVPTPCYGCGALTSVRSGEVEVWCERCRRAGLDACPKCGAELRDLRHTGFNAAALASQRVCYRWSDSEFTCNCT
jgi:hypothetical protein